jgi:hypothetical protein
MLAQAARTSATIGKIKMNDLKCPHCYSAVPWGAKVCTGCQAEVDYGAPNIAMLAVLVATLFAGFWVSSTFGSEMAGVIVGMVLFIAGFALLAKVFAHRAMFHRQYRTK